MAFACAAAVAIYWRFGKPLDCRSSGSNHSLPVACHPELCVRRDRLHASVLLLFRTDVPVNHAERIRRGFKGFIRDEQGDDEPARGWIRVEPGSGAMTATRLEVGLARTDVHARIDVRFGRDPTLQLWLPTEMRDEYSAPSGERVEGKARYRNFKRFEVEASWRAR
jgi:hypothetical protein